MYSVKTASLVLKTNDITNSPDFLFNYTDYTGERGSINKSLSSITWNNIDLRTLLGDMYDEYDEFNLVLKQVASNQANARFEGTPFNSRGVYIKMSGLPFLNSTYDIVTRRKKTSTILGAFNIPSGGWVSQLFSDSIVTFGKSQLLCNITIDLCEITDDDVVFFGDPTGNNGAETNDSLFSLSMTFPNASSTLTNANLTSSVNSCTGWYVSGDGIPKGTQVIGNGAGPPGTYTINKTTTIDHSPGNPTLLTIYSAMPLFIFIFDIFGIPKNKNNLNNTRI